MKLSRLVLLAAAIFAVAWIVRHRAELGAKFLPSAAREGAAARPGDDALREAAKEADKAQGGDVTENMTPDQVRALLGNPDAIESSGTRERWIYRQAGKAVVFRDGVAVRVESP